VVAGDWTSLVFPGTLDPATGQGQLVRNGNYGFDGCTPDSRIGFGHGDLPITAAWTVTGTIRQSNPPFRG
jgi:hypothetical protein